MSTRSRANGSFLQTFAQTLDTKCFDDQSGEVSTSPRRLLIDRLHDGKFDDRLRAMRAEGLSHRQIAEQLTRDGYDVSHETVRQWCLEIEQAS